MRYIPLLLLLALLAPAASSQEIVTADQFFNQVSERYGQVNDYECALVITASKKVMKGVLSFRAPSLLRIDFREPPDQVIVFDGKTLTVYIPELRAILSQTAGDNKPSAGGGAPGGPAGGAALASREGLKMMKRSYTVAYESTPEPVPLGEGGAEKAVCLLLSRKTVAEGFKTIKLYVSPETKLIRRIQGWNLAGEELVFDFTSIRTNQGIPAARFVYDSPASANVYNNFLFASENP